MNRIFVVLIAVPILLPILLLAVPSLLCAQTTGNSPRDCVLRAGEAIDTANARLFLENVYVDELLHSGIEVFLADMQKSAKTGDLPPMLTLLLSQISDPGRKQTIKTLLATELKAFLLNGISSGAFAGRTTGHPPNQGLLAPLFAHASMGRKELIQIQEGFATTDGWCVPCTLLDYGNGMEYPIDALIQEVDGRPMVTAIRNLPELLARIREEARQYEQAE